jgi:hypothetical protein
MSKRAWESCGFALRAMNNSTVCGAIAKGENFTFAEC